VLPLRSRAPGAHSRRRGHQTRAAPGCHSHRHQRRGGAAVLRVARRRAQLLGHQSLGPGSPYGRARGSSTNSASALSRRVGAICAGLTSTEGRLFDAYFLFKRLERASARSRSSQLTSHRRTTTAPTDENSASRANASQYCPGYSAANLSSTAPKLSDPTHSQHTHSEGHAASR
jgi:hypothetical protein